jgi:hypothetical protein
MKLLDDGNIYFPTKEGYFVSENQRRIAEILNDYDPNLELQWIPPNERGVSQKAFRVVDTNPNGPSYAVCFADECDERLLAQIFHSDQKRNGNNALTYLDNHNAAVELMNKKKEMEQRSEDHALVYSVLRSPKIHYRHNGIDFGRIT